MNKNKRPVCVCVFHVIVTVSPPRHTLDASGDDARLFFFLDFGSRVYLVTRKLRRVTYS